jgi:HSP20 family molecular chaperone IbpA
MARPDARENAMTATTNRGLAGNSRTVRADVPRVVGGRGWQGGEKREGTAWRPAVDISERRDAYLVTVEVPGITAGQVEISIANGLLTIQGERHDAREAGPQDNLIPVRATQVTAFPAPVVTRDDRPC